MSVCHTYVILNTMFYFQLVNLLNIFKQLRFTVDEIKLALISEHSEASSRIATEVVILLPGRGSGGGGQTIT